MATIQEYASLINATNLRGVKTSNVGNWRKEEIFNENNKSKTGFHGDVYVNDETKEAVIVYEGSSIDFGKKDSKERQDFLSDWQKNDTALVNKEVVPQIEKAVELYNAVAGSGEYKGYAITTTGHSLGGALAYAVSSETGCHAESYNNPSVIGAKYKLGEVEKTISLAENAKEHLTAGDAVSETGQHGKNVDYLKTEYTDRIMLLEEMKKIAPTGKRFVP